MFAVNTFHLIQTLKKERKKRNIKHVDLLVYTWEPFNASGQIYMPLASAFSLRICGPTNPSDTKKKVVVLPTLIPVACAHPSAIKMTGFTSDLCNALAAMFSLFCPITILTYCGEEKLVLCNGI